jgi:hypothetical protein
MPVSAAKSSVLFLVKGFLSIKDLTVSTAWATVLEQGSFTWIMGKGFTRTKMTYVYISLDKIMQ